MNNKPLKLWVQNNKKPKQRFLHLVNANFGSEDKRVITYSSTPLTCEDAERELRNFLRRIKSKRKKAGLPPLKYISISECTLKENGVTPARIYHNVIMNGGLNRDEIMESWRGIGCVCIGGLLADIMTLCDYLFKQTNDKMHWNSSHNLNDTK